VFYFADIFGLPAHGVAGVRALLGLDKTGVVVGRQRPPQRQAQEPAGQPGAEFGGEEPAHFPLSTLPASAAAPMSEYAGKSCCSFF